MNGISTRSDDSPAGPRPAPGAPVGNALVTGGAKRIGRAICLGLARDGWTVGIHCHTSRGDAEALRDEIAAAGGAAYVVAADLGDAAAPRPLLAEAAALGGPVTCLVNNASVFGRDDARSATPESWEEHMATNLRAPFFLSQAMAEALTNAPETPEAVSGAGGNIVNIVDQRVWAPTPHFFSYTISKMALWDMTQVMARSLAPRIRVNAIGPGPTLPNSRQSPGDFERQSRATILGRGTTPDEICAAIRFILASPAMTGQMIALDGGQHLAWETPDTAIPE